MANNYTQFSFAIREITAVEEYWLKNNRAKHWAGEPQEDEPDCGQFDMQIDGETVYFSHDESGDVTAVANFVSAFLQAHRPAEVVRFEWAETCSKPRVDEFGGGACAVSATKCLFRSTGQLLEDMEDLLLREGPPGSSDYVLKDTQAGNGIWLRIRDLVVRVYVQDEGVIADIYAEDGGDSTLSESVSSAWAFFGENSE